MAKGLAKVDEETWERAAENVEPQDLRFERNVVYFTLSVLAWGLFWDFVERGQGGPHAQHLAWIALFVAVWITTSF